MADMQEINKIQITDQGPVLVESQIHEFEKLVEFALPADYRKFLAANNGGKPSPESFSVPGWDEEVSSVSYFYGLTRKIKVSRLDWNVAEYGDLIADGLLPIAGTATGDKVALMVKGDAVGSVWFVDCADSPPRRYDLGAQFSDFVKSLFDYDVD